MSPAKMPINKKPGLADRCVEIGDVSGLAMKVRNVSFCMPVLSRVIQAGQNASGKACNDEMGFEKDGEALLNSK
ncbi:hypothetical protein [Marinilabilia rubra]|uniref:hypothetical protein n=1 Tax=Marinilabilia rubra TaxID=2162893 RepID=UPI001304E3E3|nr:hypothetical protein [Marinilabilia rubra]